MNTAEEEFYNKLSEEEKIKNKIEYCEGFPTQIKADEDNELKYDWWNLQKVLDYENNLCQFTWELRLFYPKNKYPLNQREINGKRKHETIDGRTIFTRIKKINKDL